MMSDRGRLEQADEAQRLPRTDPLHENASPDLAAAYDTHRSMTLLPLSKPLPQNSALGQTGSSSHISIGTEVSPVQIQFKTSSSSPLPAIDPAFEGAHRSVTTSQVVGRRPYSLEDEDPVPTVNDNSPRAEIQPESTNIHYGGIPQRAPCQFRKKKIPLYHGNLVCDTPVPSKLLDMCINRTNREFTHMRYIAATCQPDEFVTKKYPLRQNLYDTPRRTELFVILTMYNEDEELFTRTMYSVMKNIAYFCTRDRSMTWGRESWKKVVVCIISQGRDKINTRTLSVLATMGVYQHGIAKNAVNNKPVIAHIYEYTTQISIHPSLRIEGAERGVVPVQIIFCLKEKNQGRINSHQWALNAFGQLLQPNVCISLEIGSVPGPTSLYHLWKSFEVDPNVGGACGEVVTLKGRYALGLLNPLIAAQNFEYKMENNLRIPLGSVFGYVPLLPGVFFAYRYIALQNDEVGEGPLERYFFGNRSGETNTNMFDANMYLDEDRILPWALFTKRHASWTLRYVRSAYVVQDVPDNTLQLRSQRSRWLAGEFFMAIYSIAKFWHIFQTYHSSDQKLLFHLQLFYLIFDFVQNWLAPGHFYIILFLTLDSVEDSFQDTTVISIVNRIVKCLSLVLLGLSFLLALVERLQRMKRLYDALFLGYGLITAFLAYAVVSVFFNDRDLAALLRVILVSLAGSSFLFLEPWHLITCFVQYILIMPSYIAVLNAHSLANTHRIRLSASELDNVQTDLGVVTSDEGKNVVELHIPMNGKDVNAGYEDAIACLAAPPQERQTGPAAIAPLQHYGIAKIYPFLAWVFSNGAVALTVILLSDSAADVYPQFILFLFEALILFRYTGSFIYASRRLFRGE